jgi:hypothetical protein
VAVVVLDPLPMRLSLVCGGLVGIAAGVVAARTRMARNGGTR